MAGPRTSRLEREAGRRIGSGGEADVFTVPGRPHLVFKRYRAASPERDDKLRSMLAHPPRLRESGPSVRLAWPCELVTTASGRIEGFLMPRVDLATHVPVFQLYNPASRRVVAPGFNWQYLAHTARNLAAVLVPLHEAGYVVGDLNESNLLVSHRAEVALVDCDSMQVRDPGSGRLYPCPVAKAEFLAPELYRRDLATAERTPASDNFALAVLICLLLTEGVHPYAGIWRGRGDPPDIGRRIRRAWFPYRWPVAVGRLRPPPTAIGFGVLPPAVRRLARRAFTAGTRRTSRRPTAAEWRGALEAVEAGMRTCRRSPHHRFAGSGRRCPWCARIGQGFPDPFPGPGGAGISIEPSCWLRARRGTRRATRLAVAAGGSAGSWLARRARRGLANMVAWSGAGRLAARTRTRLDTWWQGGRGALPAAAAAAVAGWLRPVAGPVVFGLVVLPAAGALQAFRMRRPRRWATGLRRSALALRWSGPAAVAGAAVVGYGLPLAGLGHLVGRWWDVQAAAASGLAVHLLAGAAARPPIVRWAAAGERRFLRMGLWAVAGAVAAAGVLASPSFWPVPR